MFFLVGIVFFYVCCVPFVHQPLQDQKVEKYGEFQLSIPQDVFRNNDNSTIYISVTPNEYISAKYTNPQFENRYWFINFNRISADERYLYVADSDFGLIIIDYSDLSNIPVVGFLRLNSAKYIYYEDPYPYIYIATDSDGAFIIDISEKTNPVIISNFGAEESQKMHGYILVENDLAFCGDAWTDEFYVFNISEKSNPFQVGMYDIIKGSSLIQKTIKRDNLVFIADTWSGILILDIANLTNITKVSSFDEGLAGYCKNIFVVDNYAYVSGDMKGFFILNITDPTNPQELGSYEINPGEKVWSLVVVNDIAYVPNYKNEVYVIDTKNKTGPRIINTVSVQTGMDTVYVANRNLIIVAATSKGIPFLNIENATDPTITNVTYDYVGFASHELKFDESSSRSDLFDFLVFAYDDRSSLSDQIIILDTRLLNSNSQLKLVGEIDLNSNPLLPYMEIVSFFVFDGFVYITDSNTFPDMLHILNISQNFEKSPDLWFDMVYTGGVEIDSIKKVYVSEEVAYVTSHSTHGLYLVDVSNKTNPMIISKLYTEKQHSSIFVSGNFVFVTENGNDFYIYNCSNTSDPVLISEIDVGIPAFDIFFQEPYVYLACGSDGLKIIDTTNKQSPVLVGSSDGYNSNGVYLVEGMDYAIVSDLSKGLFIFDVTNRQVPVLSSEYNENGLINYPYDIIAKGNYVYLADYKFGIDMVRMDIELNGNSLTFPSFCGETEISITAKDFSGEISTSFKVFKADYCFGHGICLKNYQCSCSKGYYGDQCETWSCFGYDFKDVSKVCSGNGECVKEDECKCRGAFVGTKCNINTLYYSVLLPTTSVSGILVILAAILLCLLCLLCVCIFCCMVFLSAGVFMCGLCCIVLTQFRGLKRYGKLRNFDLLLTEQKMEDDISIAHLRINKSLFEIKFEEIKTIEILGEGGSQSIVFKAIWKGKECAFKCFKTRTLMSSQDKYDEFEREVGILSSIAHPSIIRFFGACLNHPRVGILMEFCSKGELLEFVIGFREKYDNEYPIFEKIRLLTEVVSAMEFLHSKNIIHRDLKCENVLIDEAENAKLMDFGVSKLVDSMSAAKTRKIGTSIYMAPEIITSEEYNEKCDVFSFGIMTYILFTENSRPYGTNEHQIEMKVATNSDFRPNMKDLEEKIVYPGFDWMYRLIEKCWDGDSKNRPSFLEIREILEKRMGSFHSLEDNTTEEGKFRSILGVRNSQNNKLKISEEENFLLKKRNSELENEVIRFTKLHAELEEKLDLLENENTRLKNEAKKETIL